MRCAEVGIEHTISNTLTKHSPKCSLALGWKPFRVTRPFIENNLDASCGLVKLPGSEPRMYNEMQEVGHLFVKLLAESAVKLVNIEELLPDKSNLEIAVDSLNRGMGTGDTAPLKVYRSGRKYVIADGHHRLLQSILAGKSSILVRVDTSTSVSRKGTINLDPSEGRYFGLDRVLENGWLLKRL